MFAAHTDPLGTKAVESLARPGGNITGLSIQSSDLAGKRLQLIRQILPSVKRIAVMFNVADSGSRTEVSAVESTASTLGIEITRIEVRQASEIAAGLENLDPNNKALFVSADPLMATHRVLINSVALAKRLPTVHGLREYVDSGGLMSYGVNFPDQFRRAAEIVDKILKGANPKDIPVEQPTKFELVVNLQSAKALGLRIPESLLVRADAIIS